MIPPPAAVISVAPPAVNVAPVADPDPPNDESSVAVVPLKVEILTVPDSVTPAPPPEELQGSSRGDRCSTWRVQHKKGGLDLLNRAFWQHGCNGSLL